MLRWKDGFTKPANEKEQHVSVTFYSLGMILASAGQATMARDIAQEDNQ